MSRIVTLNTTNGTFEVKNLRPELYTVATGGYADDLHGVGVAQADTFLPTQLVNTMHYSKVGKMVLVQGYIVLDASDSNPITTGSNEVRIQTQAAASDEPPAWGVQLPIPAHASRTTGATEEPGGSEPLLNVDFYDESDVRVDGAVIVSETTGTGQIKARVLADGRLALVEVRICDGDSALISPVNQVALTSARLVTMSAWGQAAGSQLRLVIYGQYYCA